MRLAGFLLWLLAAGLTHSVPIFAQTYPAGPMHMTVPFPPPG